ncbi:type 4a pilus biogenesis protein PilO [Caedibacter taeniospiralis]|jgi:type IV pilus assembly protein PilO|uniref:type 4a pilus biogenesis protein PilO n=1 Tax=Caedibacter taeniospiralis TaxID=28907 RepID=UPI0037BFA9E0
MKRKLILLLDKLSLQPLWLKLVISTVLLIVVVWLGYVTVVSMSYQEKKDSRTLEKQYKKSLIKNIGLSKSIPVLQQQVDLLQDKLNKSMQALPSDSELPQLIEELSDLAFQNGLRVKMINPQPLDYKENYAVLNIQLACDGTFEQLSRFVNELQTLPRIILIESYSLNPYAATKTDMLQMSMSLQTFSLKVKPVEGGV